jgi:F-box interacting protein
VEYPTGTVASNVNEYTRYGFGYDSQSDDYKVLRAVEFRGADFDWIGTEAKLYSLKSNSWRKVPDFPYRIPRTREWAVHVNGALHTIVFLSESGQSILAFDIRTDKTYIVPKPEKLVSIGDLRLYALEGCLCLLSPFKKHGTEVWIMKEYGVKESWTRLLSIAPPRVEPYTNLCPVAISKNGDEVLLNLNEEKLVWYDLRRKTTREVTIRGLPFRFYANVCVGSLISPDIYDVGNEINKPNRQDKRNVKIRRKRYKSRIYMIST